MAQPIYKLYLFNWKDAWYQLSQDEQNNLIAKHGEELEKVGGNITVLGTKMPGS